MGRIDDVMNVSGHRISTTEVESALVDHPAVAEAAVVGKNDDLTGQADRVLRDAQRRLRGHARSSPRNCANTSAKSWASSRRPSISRSRRSLPKTRSGKIMRRLLRDIAEGRNLGDTTTLADSNVVAELQARAAAEASKDD